MVNDAPPAIATLVRSSVRIQLLDELIQSPKTLQELDTSVDASRRTVLRNLNLLKEEGWVRQPDNCYHLVPVAERFIIDVLDDIERANRIQRLSSLLARVPEGTIDVPTEVLEKSKVITRRPSYPSAPLDEVTDVIDTSSKIQTFVPTVNSRLIDSFQAFLKRGRDLQIIVGLEGLETIRSLQNDLSTSFFQSLYVYDQVTEPVGTIKTDGMTFILVYDDNGTIHGIIASPQDRLRTWSAEFYEQRLDAASPITVLDDSITSAV